MPSIYLFNSEILGKLYLIGTVLSVLTTALSVEIYVDNSFAFLLGLGNKMLLTSTTILHDPLKTAIFTRVVSQMEMFHPKLNWLVINEYYPFRDKKVTTCIDTKYLIRCHNVCNKGKCQVYEHVPSAAARLSRDFPHLFIVQKQRRDAGQARSLNMIFSALRHINASYWVHWEESWIPVAPFVHSALSLMREHALDQLQLNHAVWENSEKELQDDNVTIHTKPYLRDQPRKWEIFKWPLFSLQPSMNRVDFLRRCLPFDESMDRWPVQFEYDFGVCTLRLGIRKGVVRTPVAIRAEGHVSSYS